MRRRRIRWAALVAISGLVLAHGNVGGHCVIDIFREVLKSFLEALVENPSADPSHHVPEFQEGDCLGIRVGLGWPGGQGPRVGALTGGGASGGAFITTSGFSSDALTYVERLNPRVILIDAKQLGRLMVEYGVGVTTTQTLRGTEVDENFFDGE